MFKKYRDLLPSYLNGENIGKHGAIINAMDKELDDKIELLRLWNVLERPILIEKNQTSYSWGTLKVHINTPTPIKELYVKGVYDGTTVDEETITYTEDELTTTVTRNYNLHNKIYVGINGVTLPTYNVQVTTHDDTVYTKQWPENDTKRGNNADHDVFLDIIGTLLGIQRRKYSKYSTHSVSSTIPPFNAKQEVITPSSVYIGECTEDDYYYYLRLKQFITGFGEEDTLTLMANVLYSVDSNIIEWDTTRWYPVGIDTLTIPLHLRQGNYPNYPVTNITSLLEQFVPVTRDLLPFLGTDYIITISNASYYPNFVEWEGTVTLDDMPVRDATLDCYMFTPTFHVSCVTDGNGDFYATYGGTPPLGSYKMMYVEGANLPSYATPITATTVVPPLSVFCMNLVAWSSRKYVGTWITDTTNASNPDSSTVDAGNGVLTWTPLVDFELVDTDSYKISISFHYTDNFQRVGFAKITDNTTTAEYTDGVMLNVADYLGSSDLNTTHTLVARFLNGIMYLYLDGDYTGRNYDYTDTTEGMLNFVAFNNRTSTGDNLLIGGGSVDATVDINTPPNPPTPAIPESLNIDYSTTWTGNGTRTIQSDGTVLITRPNNTNRLNIEIPHNDWLLTVDIEPTDNSGTLYIVNDTEGSILFRYLLSAKTSIVEYDSSQTESKRTNLENFVDGSSVTRNTLYVKRTGNNITFSYKGVNNNDVTYTREYEDADGITGINFYKYANNNNFTVHSVKLLNQGRR